MSSRFWRALPGYAATALLVLATSLWTFWGTAELYYEGWGIPLPEPLFYLVPAALCLLLTLLALAWPAVGGTLILVGGAAFTAWWWDTIARRSTLSLPAALSMVPVSAVLVLVGVLFLLEARYRRQLRASGERPPAGRFRRHLRYIFALGIPLLVAVGVSAWNLPVVLTRLDDGDYGARRIHGNGVTLVWAPAGPGWGRGSREVAENLSWDELARYGVPPVGFWEKGLSGDATAEDMRRTGLCRYLSADGLALLDTPQDIWRMPTMEELVRSLVRDGENAGCSWDGHSERAVCPATPDKETPLWAPPWPAIYYWSGDEYNATEAYYVDYSGSMIGHQPKGWGNPRHGFRCVREP